MDGMMPYQEQLETSYRLRTQRPLDLREENNRITRIKAHASVEEPNADRCAELMLMTAASYDMDRYFCGDVEEYIQNVTERFRTYAKQYVELQNTLNGFSGDEPLPPNVIFEGVVRF
jgi:hypothetical protein